MKLLGPAAVLVALLATGCASSGAPKTDLSHVPKPLRAFIHTTIRDVTKGNTIDAIDVYGPGSRAALNAASDGDVVTESTAEKSQRFYLLVLRGTFVCAECLGPGANRPRATAPTGTVETRIWSPQEGATDFGFEHSVPPDVAKLHKLATIAVS